MNRHLTLAALLSGSVMAFASSAQALPTFISDAYGTFLGTWSGNLNEASGGDTLETFLKTAYPGIEPFASLGDPDPDPYVNQLNPVGKVDPPPGQAGRLDVTVDQSSGADKIGGEWTYLAGDPNTPPGDETIDFYLVVKWSEEFSVFYYPEVDPEDSGRWTTSLFVLNAAGAAANGANWVDIPICGDGPLSAANCIPMNTNPDPDKPRGVSHVEAYWPRIAQTEAPEPLSIGLFGLGLLALGAVRRRRAS